VSFSHLSRTSDAQKSLLIPEPIAKAEERLSWTNPSIPEEDISIAEALYEAFFRNATKGHR
jgi:hypothetical protein